MQGSLIRGGYLSSNRNSISNSRPKSKLIEILSRLTLQESQKFKPTSPLQSAHSSEKILLDTSGTEQTESDLSTSLQKIQFIRQQVIGLTSNYLSPFGFQLTSLYVDHTATNRPYAQVESMIQHAKLFTANPHTEFSHYGQFTTKLMTYSCDSLLKSFSASPSLYTALPAGNGVTGCIDKVIRILQQTQSLIRQHPKIFFGPYEHHSNILPWVEYYDSVQILSHDQTASLLLSEVKNQLLACTSNSLIVSVSAASNVTSQFTDLKGLNQVIKEVRKTKSVIFCLDCAAYCSHQALNLKEVDEVDFVFLSPHKNLGGAESCGVLIARKQAIRLSKPSFPGGGTVRFVKGVEKEDIVYQDDIFAREISGTPPYLGFYRAALSFQLLHRIGYEFIQERQQRNTQYFRNGIEKVNKRFADHNHSTRIVLFGETEGVKRGNVITFNFQRGQHFVKHDFVSLILADVFGVQVRSGCFCAGPFGIILLGLDSVKIAEIKEQVNLGILKEKPGYLRLDLAFYLEEFEVKYLIDSLEAIALYWENMQKVYDVCLDGQILRHSLTEKNKSQFHFGLDSFQAVSEIQAKEQSSIKFKLKHRHQILQEQLANAILFLKNPLPFLKKILQ